MFFFSFFFFLLVISLVIMVPVLAKTIGVAVALMEIGLFGIEMCSIVMRVCYSWQ